MRKEKEVPLTLAGLKTLEDELEVLKTVRRREVAQRIKQAVEYGDISENSEYEDAKNEQAFIEGRILTLEKMLRNARIIEHEKGTGETVELGSTVTLRDPEKGNECHYTIVGSAEADPGAKKISNESPLGKALLGKAKGCIIEIAAPAGLFKYQIVDVS